MDGAGLDNPRSAAEELDRTALVPVRVRVAPAACNGSATWRLDHGAAGPRMLTKSSSFGCSFILRVRPGVEHRLAVDLGRGWVWRRFSADDALIVAVGDSVASGEGNPADQGRAWASARCHRSPVAGVEQASRLLGQARSRNVGAGADRRDRDVQSLSGVTFVSLACSGATITQGLLGSYTGIQDRDGPAIPPQVGRLRELVARTHRRPDAVLMSIGANDVHFGDVVRLCALQPSCPEHAYDPDHVGPGTTADIAVGHALGRLGARYDRLAKGLRGIRAGRVFITEYFDPTRGTRGATCPAVIKSGVSRAELDWAQTSLLAPLNDEVAAAAHRNGWTEVTGIAAAFSTHGYCAPPAERWIRRLEEALAQHDPAGTMHPNAGGQQAIAQALTAAVGVPLGFVVAPARGALPGRAQIPWPTIGWAAAGGAVLLYVLLFATAGRRAVTRRFRRRLRNLARHGHDHAAAAGAYRRPNLDRYRLRRGPGASPLVDAVIKAGTTLIGAVVSVGFVVVVGAAIVWVRFWAARYPADQAVDAVSRNELLVIGAQALFLFVLLAVVAVVAMWLLDPEGTPGPRMTIALGVLIFAELAGAVFVGGFGTRQLVQLVVGFAVAAALLVVVFNVLRRLLPGLRRMHRLSPLKGTGYVLGRYFERPRSGDVAHRGRKMVVLLLLAVAVGAIVVWQTDIDGSGYQWWWWLILAGITGVLLVLLWLTRFTLQLMALLALAVALDGALRVEHGDSRAASAFVWVALAVLLFAAPRPVGRQRQSQSKQSEDGQHRGNVLKRYLWEPLKRWLTRLIGRIGRWRTGVAEWWHEPWRGRPGIALRAFKSWWKAGNPDAYFVEDDPHNSYLRAARAAIAMTLLACLAIFLVRDEPWLALSALAAVALAGLCVATAWVSGTRFALFGITVFFSVLVFGAVLACLRTIDSPEA